MPTPPPSVAAALPDEPWVPLSGSDPDGDEGWFDHTWPGRSWRVGRHIVRVADPEDGRTLGDEVARSSWLDDRLDVTATAAADGPGTLVVDGPGTLVVDGLGTLVVDGNWLVIDAGASVPSHRPEVQPEPDAVPAALGEALRRLHDLDTASCPFTRTWVDVVGELTTAVEHGAVRVDRLREPYSRYEPARLVELVEEGRPTTDDDVVAHGGPTLSNLLLTPGGAASFIGVHRLGVADRHLDLAVVTNQLQLAFGPEALYGFYDGYGRDPDLVRLDHFILIDAITAAIDPQVVRR